MIGRVGPDAEGSALIESLKQAGVDTRYTAYDQVGPSGLSVAIVTAEGDYGAVIVSGVNKQVGEKDLLEAKEIIRTASLLVLQLELDIDIVTRAAELAKANDVPVLLNAAPAYPLPSRLSSVVDYLVVNQIEAEMLTGIPTASRNEAEEALTRLQGVIPTVIITLGGQGVLFSSRTGDHDHLPAHAVKLVDTHGAGDSFVGAFCARLVIGVPLVQAVAYANATAALMVATEGSDFVEPRAVERFLGL